MTGPFALIEAVHASRRAGRAVAPDAAKALRALVATLASREVVAGRGTPVRIASGYVDDAVSSVVLCLLEHPEKPRDAVLGHDELRPLGSPETAPGVSDALRSSADRIVVGYVRKMLGNLWMTMIRKGLAAEAPAAPPRSPDDEAARDAENEAVARVRGNLASTAGAAERSLSRADYARNFARDYAQLVALADGTTTMDELVRAELPDADAAPTARDRGAVAARIYKRHERARTLLLDTLDAVPPRVDLLPDERLEVRRAVVFYLTRCQTWAAPSSQRASTSSGAGAGPRVAGEDGHE